MLEGTLAGCRIGVPESRELDVFTAMLERRGAQVMRCPLVGILDAPDPQPVLAWLEAFCAGSCDDLILLTGEGLRRLSSCIEQHRPALREPFVAQLAAVRKITRGPKPARALRELGLKPDIAPELATTAGIINGLSAENFSDRTVGVQLYGSEPNLPLIQFLQARGARVLTVAPYVYADRADDAAVLALIEQMELGAMDVMTFTSMAQVKRLFAVADETRLQKALAKTAIAAVGPVVAEALKDHGASIRFMPAESFFMKPLVTEIERARAAANI